MNIAAAPSLRRLGIVQFDLADMLVNPARYAPIVERMAIVRADVDLSTNRVSYLVWDASFGRVPECERPPRYEVTVFDGRLMFSLHQEPTFAAASM